VLLGAAALLELAGQSRIIAPGPAYFIEARNSSEVCPRKTPLTFSRITVHRVTSGGSFNGKDWKGTVGDVYRLSALNGELRVDGSNHEIY